MLTMKEQALHAIIRKMFNEGTFHPVCVAVLETTTGAHILRNLDSDDLGATFAIPAGTHEQVTGIFLYDEVYGYSASDYRRFGEKPVIGITADPDMTGLKPGKLPDMNAGMIEARYCFRIGELGKLFKRFISDEYTTQEDGVFYQNLPLEDVAF